eukprot:SM000019S05088  [mRNA]  locus=s19:885074:887305:- [translate_table: standard]
MASPQARQLLAARPAGHVVATCRDPGGAPELRALADASGGRLTVLPLDVTREDTIAAAASCVEEAHGRLDLLVNTAGILHIPGKVQPETSLGKVNPEALLLTYQVNAMGPILVLKHMHKLLKAGGGRGLGRPGAVVANLSARVGSIRDNALGGWYAYRASKTALNQLTKTAAVEIARRREPIILVLLHPGTVNTGLSKPFQRNVPEGKLFTPTYSVERLLGIVDGLKLADSGRFFAWDGQEIPW